MSGYLRRLAGMAGVALFAVMLSLSPAAQSAENKIRIAFGDIESVETLNFLIAIERAKEKGVTIEVNYLKEEDIAAQAVVSGEADVGVGTPYALVQKVKAPIRMFYQMSALRFYPIVNTEFYKSWKDLDGQEVAVHSRGSGTEAIMKLMAQRNGITYSNISYVAGAEVRAGALLQGNIKASIVDAANRRMIEEKAPGKFAVLPMEGVNASDEALYANTEFLSREQGAVDILVESLLTTWREINANPASVADLRKKYNLLTDLPADLEPEVIPYYEESVASGAFPNNGGGEEAVKDDFGFYSVAGQIEGDPAALKAEDFWDFGPLNRALDKLGRI
jgi:ABC-type nitrate/sulfonate/bicarbonate transport system substrate-binding protein